LRRVLEPKFRALQSLNARKDLGTVVVALRDRLFSRLATQAFQAITSVKTTQPSLRQARALRDIAAAGLLTALGRSASAKHNSSGDNNFKAGLDASWEPETSINSLYYRCW
jgi:hypothetical protein